MSKMKLKSLSIGLLLGISISFTANFIDAVTYFDKLCMDCERSFGIPFAFYESGTLLRPTRMIWSGLIIDIIFAVIVGVGIGYLILYFRRKITKKLN